MDINNIEEELLINSIMLGKKGDTSSLNATFTDADLVKMLQKATSVDITSNTEMLLVTSRSDKFNLINAAIEQGIRYDEFNDKLHVPVGSAESEITIVATDKIGDGTAAMISNPYFNPKDSIPMKYEPPKFGHPEIKYPLHVQYPTMRSLASNPLKDSVNQMIKECVKKGIAMVDLDIALTKLEIEHSFENLFDGYQIKCFDYKGKEILDFIQHSGSYGSQYNLIEIASIYLPLRKVLGYLSVDEAVLFAIQAIQLSKKININRIHQLSDCNKKKRVRKKAYKRLKEIDDLMCFCALKHFYKIR